MSLDQRWEDKEANLLRCRELVARAAGQGADLAILPEMTLTGFTLNTARSVEDSDASATLANLGELARQYRIGLVAGLVLNVDGQPANTLAAFSGDGTEQARYTKIHPFPLPGRIACSVEGNDWRGWRCRSSGWDSRFATTCGFRSCLRPWRRIATSSSISRTGRSAGSGIGERYFRRAPSRIRCLSWGVNRTGTDGNGFIYEHSSMVVDANGEVVPPIFREGEIDIVEIHGQALADFRRSFSTRQDRRPDLYRVLI